MKSHYISSLQNRKKQSPTTMGGPAEANLILLNNRNSAVLERRPAFTWSKVVNATKYTFNIYDRNESVICTGSTTDTQINLPNRCQSLRPGEYKWDVTAQIGKQTSNKMLYDAASFTVVTEQRAAEISNVLKHAQAILANNAEAILVYVTTLMEYKLYPQAELELIRALERAPTNRSLWALLIETYARMKRYRTREKAREISTRNPTVEMIRAL